MLAGLGGSPPQKEAGSAKKMTTLERRDDILDAAVGLGKEVSKTVKFKADGILKVSQSSRKPTLGSLINAQSPNQWNPENARRENSPGHASSVATSSIDSS